MAVTRAKKLREKDCIMRMNSAVVWCHRVRPTGSVLVWAICGSSSQTGPCTASITFLVSSGCSYVGWIPAQRKKLKKLIFVALDVVAVVVVRSMRNVICVLSCCNVVIVERFDTYFE